jgi:hypothetical protein
MNRFGFDAASFCGKDAGLWPSIGDETSGRVDRRQHAVDVPVSK